MLCNLHFDSIWLPTYMSLDIISTADKHMTKKTYTLTLITKEYRLVADVAVC